MDSKTAKAVDRALLRVEKELAKLKAAFKAAGEEYKKLSKKKGDNGVRSDTPKN